MQGKVVDQPWIKEKSGCLRAHPDAVVVTPGGEAAPVFERRQPIAAASERDATVADRPQHKGTKAKPWIHRGSRGFITARALRVVVTCLWALFTVSSLLLVLGALVHNDHEGAALFSVQALVGSLLGVLSVLRLVERR